MNTIDNQDKKSWCEYGARLEVEFVKLNPCFVINPEKYSNKYAPDLINICAASGITDLKTQQTQFRTSSRYGVPSEYAVSFNEKDGKRYAAKYPEIVVLFWVKWLDQVYSATLDLLRILCNKQNKHVYQDRMYDYSGNAKCSYVIDVRKMNRIR